MAARSWCDSKQMYKTFDPSSEQTHLNSRPSKLHSHFRYSSSAYFFKTFHHHLKPLFNCSSKMYATTFSIFILTLAASTAYAAPGQVKRQTAPCMLNTVMNPNTSQVANSITQWNADVDAVNTFLNTALTLPVGSLSAAAQNAFNMAQDEPCQLMYVW
jgi:hypothetical protein